MPIEIFFRASGARQLHLVTVPEVARHWGCSPRVVYAMHRIGALAPYEQPISDGRGSIWLKPEILDSPPMTKPPMDGSQ